MATYTIDEIQARVGTLIDQVGEAPTNTTSEYAWRLKFINRAYQEWAMAYDWEALRKELWVSITGTSQATVTLPADFNKMAMHPILYGSIENGESWPEIRPEDRTQYTTSDKYFYLLGSRESKSMIWNPGTLASGASLVIAYFSYPTSLASPSNVPLIPEPEFLVERTIAYILETRGDPRYQQSESKAREFLLQMIDNENNKGVSLLDTIENVDKKYYGFRIGRD